jgi:four helix bundle protein
MALLQCFRDLEVSKLAREQAGKIFMITKAFPKEERYSLTDQIRRSSRAVNAIIAEAWGRRRHPGAFMNKIEEAMSEAMETQAWLDHALDCNYVDASQHRELDRAWHHVSAMLNRMIERADTFCRVAQPRK